MKGNEIGGAGDEARCRLAGDLVERALPETRPSLKTAEWDRLRDALVARGRRPSAVRRRRWLVSALAMVAVGGVAALFLLRAAAPVTFQVQGGASGPDGRVTTAPEQRATLRFSDGSAVTLAGASAGRVAARTADGATFAVERGHAHFDVVHRARTRWSVAVGPFEVLVTGTSFDVDWTGASGQRSGQEGERRLVVDLHVGAVTVRGALAGAGVSLRAGQRLLADLERGRLSIVEQSEGGPGASDAVTALGGPAAEAGAGVGAGVGTVGAVPGARAAAEAAREAGGARTRAGRGDGAAAGQQPGVPSTPPSGAMPLEPPALGPLVGPGPERAPFEPAPWPAPAPRLARETKVAAGGASCVGWAPQIRFDRFDGSLDGIQVGSTISLAFTHPAIDRGRSWCGAGSLRVDARFDLVGPPNRLGDRPRHAGEVLVDLPAPANLTGKTVTVHFFVEGPTDIRFGAQLFAINGAATGDRKWVGGGFTADLTTGRWWTLAHAFERENRLFEGGTSPVDHVEKLSLQLYAIGKDRVWTGRVYVDDLGWQ
ncbi:MAG TPA: FecR family protein [Polyangia bacterium]|jgi:ferric-dicitrate binding protein FerR (iron transport regulator)|nr:FecR family protein [Polyangia bacterium]